jgi:urease accessory protein
MLTPAAALFDGDVVDLDVDCGPATDVSLVTVGATRLNRCDRDAITFQLSAHVAAGAVLRYLPHELIPFRGAAYQQHITVDLAPDAHALLLEVITPGVSNDPFSYKQLAFSTRVRVDSHTIAVERFALTRKSRAALLGRTHYASLCALGPDFGSAVAEAAHTRLERAAVLGSASSLPCNGIVVKALGYSAQLLREALVCAISCHHL